MKGCVAKFIGLPVLMGCLLPARADEPRGHLNVSYQYITIDGFEGTTGKFDIGTADTQSLNVDVDFALTERLTVTAGLPLIRKRYNGRAPHVPAGLDPPADDTFVDNGGWHTYFQDFHLGARYRLTTGPLLVEPFAYFGIPSNAYPYFGQAAVGQDLNRLEIGSTFAWLPSLSDYYLVAKPSYSFVEKTLGVSINHWRLEAELGYFFTPRVSARLFVLAKQGHGSDFPDDFPPPRSDERWHQHDRMVKHNYVNGGAGVDIAINDRNSLTMSAMTMLHADQVHIMRYTLTVGISHGFD